MSELSWKILQLEKYRAIFSQSRGVLVGLSGGMDSTALLHLFCEFSKNNQDVKIGIIHLNYGLRGESSKDDEIFCRNLAKNYQIPVYVTEITEESRNSRRGQSVQEWARCLRRQAFSEFEAKGYAIALGHHKNDLAENALLRLSRGSSFAHAAGMQEVKGNLIRPLLPFTRYEIETYSKANSLAFRQDRSNFETKYDRNKIRHEVLPTFESIYPKATHRIADSAADWRDCSEYLAKHLFETYKNDIETLAKQPIGLALLGIKTLIEKRVATNDLETSRNFLLEALEAIKKNRAFYRILKSGKILTIRDHRIHVSEEAYQPNHTRSDQHRSSLQRLNFDLLLENRAKCVFQNFIRKIQVEWTDGNNPNNLSGIKLKGLSVCASKKIVPARLSSRKQELKKYWGTLKIPKGLRYRYIEIATDTCSLGVFNGTEFIEAALESRQKNFRDTLKLNIGDL